FWNEKIKILSLSCWLSDGKATEKVTQAVIKCRRSVAVTVAKRAEAAEKYFRVKKSVAK
ncbi:hypothetical protein A2U01_0054746, partial [Trifolium medium]|nr:hypothetical protein [Trifolium medium]